MANESDVKSYYTNVSSLDSAPPLLAQIRWKNVPLHERCSINDMIKLKEAFQNAYRGKLLFNEFRDTLRSLLNVEYDEEEYKLLFLKINSNRNEEIDWDEFVSHLLLGYFLNDPENQRELMQLPIMGLPKVIRSQHRHPISRVVFCPDISKDRTINYLQGNYVTASRDGMINWWTLDMTLLRTAYSSCPHLKVRTTWVTYMACMPDVNIIVTSSTERDLRFYDCTAKNFTLKIVISSWDYMICTMHYHFWQDINEKSILLCGDVGGYVRLLTFSPILRGPFQNRPGKALIELRHVDLRKRPFLLPEMKLREYPQAHTDWVRQVSFYSSLQYIVSCSTCPDALLMCDIKASKTHNLFHVDKGIHCFAIDEDAHILVTGGPDCDVRVWNPFVPSKPNIVFHGHHAGVIAIVLQNKGSRIYSISRDRVIKVWDVHRHVCVQTYIDIPANVGERSPLSVTYNPATRELTMGAIKLAIIILDEELNPLHTDGFTHSRGVSKILFNPLFKIIVTCGMDSIIICWDPFTGKRNAMIREAHTRHVHGESLPVEITAACFDPGYQLLLTGARDGSLKIWNFNTCACIRNMTIQLNNEVTQVFWVEGRILAVGWNRLVTEFEDTGTSSSGKSWQSRHTDDILAAAVRPPFTFITSTYNSELIMWKLETGQPYRQFTCMEPTLRIKMSYNKRDHRGSSPSAPGRPLSAKSSVIKRPSMAVRRESMIDPSEAMRKAFHRRVSVVPMPNRIEGMRKLAVHGVIFLLTRPIHMQVASVMVSLENGQIQCWSDHSAGGYLGSFQGIHTAGDYVSAFATDVDNDYLITGTSIGYIKIWLMINYFDSKNVHINMPKLRLQFPFLWRDRIEGRAKRSVRAQPLPLLLSSYRAHLRCITSLAYVDDKKLVFSGSSDYSVRIWRLSGEYLQTLGSFVPWTLEETRFPPDVKKIASFSTFKVWRHGEVSRYTPGQVEVDKLRDITEFELKTKTFGAPAEEPLLGNHFQLPGRVDRQDRVILDDSLPVIPLYSHLRMASIQRVRRPPTPELVKQTRLKKIVTKKAHFSTSINKTSNQKLE